MHKRRSPVDPFTWTRTYIQQLYADTECRPEDQPGAMDDRDEWRERDWEIHAGSVT